MNTTTTHNTTEPAPELWCSVCGCHLDVYHRDDTVTNHDTGKSIRVVETIGTCRNARCPMVNQTLSPDMWVDQARLLNYSVFALIQFDVRTGLAVNVMDEIVAQQITWLINYYAGLGDLDKVDRIMQYVDKHYTDEDFALVIAAFIEGSKDTPDYSNVCGLHLEGR